MQSIFNRANGLRVVVIGDVMLDHYIFGGAARLSPEAPVPVVKVLQDRWTLGGAANVALNLKTFGTLVEVIGRVGKDAAGEKLVSLFNRENILFDDGCRVENLQTITKTRVIAQRQQITRIDREQEPAVYSIDSKSYFEHVRAALENSDAVILSDYAKGTFTQRAVDEIFKIVRSQSGFIAVDPKPQHGLKYAAPDLFTPNADEALQLADYRGDLQSIDWNAVCRKIYALHRPKYLIITLGEKGMLLAKEGQVIRQISTCAREVFDVSGAGDTVIAALTVALVAGESLEEAAHFANTAAGVVVGKLGTAVATPAEMLNFECLCDAKKI